MKLSEEVKSDLTRAGLCWLATVSAEGIPNVSPKEIFAARGEDQLIIADIASPVSVRNIRANPEVCVSFIDIFRQCGFKIQGPATVLAPDDAAFAEVSAPLRARIGPAFPLRDVIMVSARRIARIRAPSYQFRPECRPEDLMREAYRLYGVMPVPGAGS